MEAVQIQLIMAQTTLQQLQCQLGDLCSLTMMTDHNEPDISKRIAVLQMDDMARKVMGDCQQSMTDLCDLDIKIRQYKQLNTTQNA